jgi:RNA polymerase sigma-70 factor (ECF subfamily)
MAVNTIDPALLRAAQQGDPFALEALLAAHREIVFRYGLRFCRTTEDAEDAVQETLWAAARSLGKFRRAAAITTWLFAIVRNTCHRLLRQHRGEEDLAGVLHTLPDPRDLIEDQVAAEQVERILANAIAHLSADHREVILLRDVEGLTAPEAASHLSINVHALKSRLHRARSELRTSLRDLASAMKTCRHRSLHNKHYDAPSAFTAEDLLREAPSEAGLDDPALEPPSRALE